MTTQNTYAKILSGARLLKETEVPEAGDWAKWSESARDEWREIPKGDTLRSGLPVATLRARMGQPTLQFCTFKRTNP